MVNVRARVYLNEHPCDLGHSRRCHGQEAQMTFRGRSPTFTEIRDRAFRKFSAEIPETLGLVG